MNHYEQNIKHYHMLKPHINNASLLGMKYIVILLLTLGFLFDCSAQGNNDTFTIYLVRHAEKENSFADSPLTPCGEERAESLCGFFRDVPLEAVYSTNYQRTQNTASPTASSKGLTVQDYEAHALNELMEELLRNKKDALVVGHSNTTGVLAGLLIGSELNDINLSIYNLIYQVVISNEGGRLHILHSSFICEE